MDERIFAVAAGFKIGFITLSNEVEHRRDRAVRFDRLAHDLSALRQVFVRDRLRRGQVRASRRNGVLIRRLGLNRFDLVHGHDLAGRPCRYSNAASIL